MRAITVRQPWAWAIVHGGKDVENRTRNIAGGYRGTVAIHAATQEASLTAGQERRLWLYAVGWPGAQPRGAVVGVVDLIDAHSHPNAEHAEAVCWPWGEPDHHHLVLANPRPLAAPVPAKGRLGLWTLPTDVEAAVLAQIVGAL